MASPLTQLVADASSAAGALSVPAGSLASFRGALGSNFERYGNLHLLQCGAGEDTVVLYAAGNFARIHNLTTGSMRYVQGRDGGGVAAVAVHPSRRVFAVAERRWTGGGGPRVYVYAYPSLEMLRVLEGGTERAYSDICFSVAPEGCPAPEVEPLLAAAGPGAGAAEEGAPPPPPAAAGGASTAPTAGAEEGVPPTGAAAPAERAPEEGAPPAGAEGAPAEAPPAPAAGDAGEAASAPPAEPAAAAPGEGATAASAAAATATAPLPAADRIVTVGGFPDFSLIVWDWAASRPMLRTKAFGQDVFNCRFSPDDPGKLVTSGVGHIRFWRLAETFTGLKLQVREHCSRSCPFSAGPHRLLTLPPLPSPPPPFPPSSSLPDRARWASLGAST
jgi:hypothetical protein